MTSPRLARAQVIIPRLRGRLHQGAFLASIPLGMTLVALGRTGVARAASGIYAVSLITLYGVSAAYHRLPWSKDGRAWMRRLDHSSIFVLIAGSYTPLSVLALDGPWRIAILSCVWGVALVGVGMKLLHFERTDRAGTIMYIALGWTALVALPRIIDVLGPAEIGLLFSGGLLYTTGAFIFIRGKPDPIPDVFGYHEVWHSMVIAGSLCHYAMILLLAVRGT